MGGAVLAVIWWIWDRGPVEREPGRPVLEPESKVFAGYAGSESCRGCHEEADGLWRDSNHAWAERATSSSIDQAAFDPGRTFVHGTQRSEVFWRAGVGRVRTVGLSGGVEEHVVQRVIGNRPLRQYLVGVEGGRLQTLEASYDPLTNAWFNVYGNEDRQPGEWGHWTGRGMNWNSMCAGCHNTRLRKNYDGEADVYRTSMAERSVGCEACHGPLKAHVDWQARYGKSKRKDPTVGRPTRRQTLDTCGFCHARRGDLTGDFKPGDLFLDHQELVTVDETDMYYADGQVREENYEYGSFLGSRMHHRGVICGDCHEPHSARTRLPGNWLCIRCHNGSYTNAPVIDPVAHSHHKVFGFDTNGVATDLDLTAYDPRRIQETGGECVNCHMPQTVYMQRHWRHDHGFTIPDPLLSKQHGIPNACNRCHADKSVDWALEACDRWYGARMNRITRDRAQWVARARAGDPSAKEILLRMVESEDLGYWRAAAVELLGRWTADPVVRDTLVRALAQPDPLVRSKAARFLEDWVTSPGSGVAAKLFAALDDPVRAVRVSAAWSLRSAVGADAPAVRELEHFLRVNADQPTGQMQLGAWWLARGDRERAVAHYARAVAWDGRSAPIRHDYAVALSMAGRAADAVRELEVACRLAPAEPEFRYKLGLAWSELGDLGQARRALEDAVRLGPDHARAWYNLGLARHQAGEALAALEALRRAESLSPQDGSVPYAMATILLRMGRREEARAAVERAARWAPADPSVQQLQQQLSGGN